MNLTRLVVGSFAVVVAVAACAPAPGASADADPAAQPTVLERVESDPREDTVSALQNPSDGALPEPEIDPNLLLSGGPPPDGIPAIDQPTFERAGDVSWLTAEEPIVALDFNGEQRAYPVQILTWHEIVNDTVGGTPVVVTYCPLCNTALAFHREHGDRVLDFGVSGFLYNSDLVMYDRQTESLWSQIRGDAIIGHLSGEQLEFIPVTTVPWSQWQSANPDGWVLSRETGHDRNYGTNPAVGYDEELSGAYFPLTAEDGRLAPKERIIAFPAASEPIAVVTQAVADAGAIQLTVDGDPVVVIASPGLTSALDSAQIAEGRAIPWTQAYFAEHNDVALAFTVHVEDEVVTLVDQRGSTWDDAGLAISGPDEGSRLEQAVMIDTFWFAWAAFNPDVTIVTE